MGRASQFFDFINSEKMPTKERQDFRYSHLTVDDDLKKTRRKYRLKLRRKDIYMEAVDFLGVFSVVAEFATKEQMDKFLDALEPDEALIASTFLLRQIEARKSLQPEKGAE